MKYCGGKNEAEARGKRTGQKNYVSDEKVEVTGKSIGRPVSSNSRLRV
jgi:hypothetical protein